MTKRLPATATPLPLEEYAAHFDDLFAQRSQREGEVGPRSRTGYR